MVADRGSNARLSSSDLPAELEAGAVLVSGYLLLQPDAHDVAAAALERARAAYVAVDAASWPLVEAFGADRFFEETSNANVVFVNEREAWTLTGLEDGPAGRALAERYAVVAVKLGARGSLLIVEGELSSREAELIFEVDPTGAGDVFAAAFFWSLHKSGGDWRTAADWANCVASFVVERRGVTGVPKLAEVEKRWRSGTRVGVRVGAP